MKVVNLRKEKYTIYIGRGSKFGNPFVIGKDGDRQDVIRKYEKYLINNKRVLNAIYNLPKEAILGCFCVEIPINFIRKNKRCHGEIILEQYNNHWNIKNKLRSVPKFSKFKWICWK